MSEPIDVYSDQFMISMGPYGANLSFMLNEPHPDPRTPAPPRKLATIRMSLEHAKVMTMVIKRSIQGMERQTGVSAGVPNQVLNQIGISPEDWNAFWQG